MPRKNFIIVSCMIISVLVPTSGSLGGTATNTFQVTVNVVASCTFTVTTLAFSNYTLAQVDNTSTITLTCTYNTSYAINLDAGTGSGATVTNRKMTNGANTLNYVLYANPLRTSIWGNTSSNNVTSAGTGVAQPFTVYGRIPANQTPAPGTYTDTITATVTF